MSSLPNYLLTHRKRLNLPQEEVAFLLGFNGMSKGSKVSRDESFSREPNLRTALAYELIYGQPVSELFAGLYEEVTQEVAARAKLLSFRKVGKSNSSRQEVITNLVSKISK